MTKCSILWHHEQQQSSENERRHSAEQAAKALLAIRLAILFLECALVELALAVCADKVLRVIFTIHCRDTAPGHRLITGDAEGAAPSMKVHLAVRQTFVIVETLRAKRSATFLQHDKNSPHFLMQQKLTHGSMFVQV